MNFKIAIASHKRKIQFENKTIKLLQKHKIDFKNVYVFVSPISYESYTDLASKYNFTLIKSYDSILKTRNHIIDYFPENDKIVEMDDDIEDVENTVKGVKNTSITDLKKILNESFELLNGDGLFGFNANTNNFFATGKNKYGLYSIINSLLGYYNDKSIKLTVPEKEDFDRACQYFKKNKTILKRTMYGVKTKYWKNKGGIQDHYNHDKRKEVQLYSANELVKKYPSLCRIQFRKSGLADIRFKPQKKLLKHKTP